LTWLSNFDFLLLRNHALWRRWHLGIMEKRFEMRCRARKRLLPATFSTSIVIQGTSIAVLTYIGFDGISTLAEEVKNPRRNILLATVLTCLAIGILSMVEVHVAQLAWLSTQPFPPSMMDTAFVHVAAQVGGTFLFQLLNATLLVANLGAAVAAQFGASRLMYSMGRDNSLPARVFGAFIALTGVNAAALVHYKLRSKEKVTFPVLIPALGILVCTFIWLHLSRNARYSVSSGSVQGCLWRGSRGEAESQSSSHNSVSYSNLSK
jgi:putrescine importer